MKQISTLLRRLRHEEEGQGLVEYGTLVTLIAVGVLSLLSLLYDQVGDIFGQISEALATVLNL